jgi:hypothetical protein
VFSCRLKSLVQVSRFAAVNNFRLNYFPLKYTSHVAGPPIFTS